ncbi:unnamed protein product [Diamesa serratosioi]
MKKQFNKIKIAAENFSSRATKPEKNDELQHVERQVEKYRDVLQIISKKISSNVPSGQGQDQAAKEKRLKKIHEYLLGQIMDESAKELPEGLFKKILDICAKLEKTIASEIVNNEINIENDVSKKLNTIIDSHISVVQKQKRIVAKCHQDNETAKQKYQSAIRLNENITKVSQLKDDQEECETKLEKERDIYASNMFDLLAEEDNISSYILNYVKYQQLYYKSALKEIEALMTDMNVLIRSSNKKVFNTSLQDHLDTTGRKISYVIELCVCCLLEKGLYEEGLLRVGCGNSKLKRMKSAIDASFVGPPIPHEYQDVHVVASVLKAYLRSLPEPLLTFEFYKDFLEAATKPSEQQRKSAILNIINQLPEGNYNNLKYLTKFLSYLSEKNQQNKMSTQNLAIVMSPNLLWPQNQSEIDQNYAQQVNSTAAVNTIVETLISDWGFFFEGEVNFYDTMSRDELFPDNGGFPYDKEQSVISSSADFMSKSMNSAIGMERDTKFAIPSPVSKLHDTANFSFIDCDDQHMDDHQHQQKTIKSTTNLKKAGSTDNLISKPDRPPRPVVMNAECQTLNRSFIRNIPLKSSSDKMTTPKPVALPRTSLSKSDLNKSEENIVAVREKPAIPERPISLMRPHSFRSGSGGLSSPTSALANEKLVEELQATLCSGASGLKKTNSFKSVDKSDDNSAVASSMVASTESNSGGSEEDVDDDKNNIQSYQVPASPRAFDAKIKRPQVPPPARPKSSELVDNSTNL